METVKNMDKDAGPSEKPLNLEEQFEKELKLYEEQRGINLLNQGQCSNSSKQSCSEDKANQLKIKPRYSIKLLQCIRIELKI